MGCAAGREAALAAPPAERDSAPRESVAQRTEAPREAVYLEIAPRVLAESTNVARAEAVSPKPLAAPKPAASMPSPQYSMPPDAVPPTTPPPKAAETGAGSGMGWGVGGQHLSGILLRGTPSLRPPLPLGTSGPAPRTLELSRARSLSAHDGCFLFKVTEPEPATTPRANPGSLALGGAWQTPSPAISPQHLIADGGAHLGTAEGTRASPGPGDPVDVLSQLFAKTEISSPVSESKSAKRVLWEPVEVAALEEARTKHEGKSNIWRLGCQFSPDMVLPEKTGAIKDDPAFATSLSRRSNTDLRSKGVVTTI
ncbi:hypothetical protein T492DRAFT_832753 [Pavlovales sp. CCMP2436]|nr:hypothetical protein T492DRAFT_832753 [Pavlovales sp. CCMP2436]